MTDVYKTGRLAARLTPTGGDTVFAYVDGYAGPAVAHTLPLGRTVTRPGRSTPAFFANLLPEGRRLSALQRAVKTSMDDELSLLNRVGADTVGDVQVAATGEPPATVEPLAADVAQADFAALLREYGIDPVAIPGAQDKLSAGMITLPGRSGTGRRAFIKLNPPDYPDAVQNEAYLLGLARGLKLPVADAALVEDSAGTPGLVVVRFDRAPEPIAAEDACQLLGRYPSDKYLVSAEEVALAVADVCAARPVALRAVFLQFVFAWLSGNGDLHAKNLSVLQGPTGEWRPSPIYDTVCTLAYDDHTMALELGGRKEGFVRRHFVDFGRAIGLTERASQGAIGLALKATERLDDDLASGALHLSANRTQTLRRQLKRRRKDVGGQGS